LKDVPLLVIANKQDIEDAKNAAEVTKDILGLEHRERITNTIPTSAIKGDGVSECIAWLEVTMSKHARSIQKD
jgi:signal recognition particle receptor subunit beta